MKASEIVEELPEENTPDRESKIINIIGTGHYLRPRMVSIESKWKGHVAIISVMSDALMVGESDDFLRINATMNGEQRIADMLLMSMMTPKIADLVYASAKIKLEPNTQTPDSKMANTSRMVKHSAAVTEAIMRATAQTGSPSIQEIANGSIGLIADVGKDWVLSNKLARKKDVAANYGWHTKAKVRKGGPFSCLGGGAMWQALGTTHNTKHVDYSQVVRLMSTELVVNGKTMSFHDVASDPKLCGLVSYEGPLIVFRHPESATVSKP
jgi:hypothetical protein